jgi:hypothetical protein
MEKHVTLQPNNDLKVHLNSRVHIEEFARHLFKNDPAGLAKVNNEFGEHRVAQTQIGIKHPKPRDFVMHHIPQ